MVLQVHCIDWMRFLVSGPWNLQPEEGNGVIAALIAWPWIWRNVSMSTRCTVHVAKQRDITAAELMNKRHEDPLLKNAGFNFLVSCSLKFLACVFATQGKDCHRFLHENGDDIRHTFGLRSCVRTTKQPCNVFQRPFKMITWKCIVPNFNEPPLQSISSSSTCLPALGRPSPLYSHTNQLIRS